MGQFPEVDPNLDLPALDARTLELWRDRKVFQRSVDQRVGAEPFVFYEGRRPPTAGPASTTWRPRPVPGSRPCAATGSTARAAGTATACRSSWRSRRSWSSRTSRRSRPTGSRRSTPAAASRSSATSTPWSSSPSGSASGSTPARPTGRWTPPMWRASGGPWPSCTAAACWSRTTRSPLVPPLPDHPVRRRGGHGLPGGRGPHRLCGPARDQRPPGRRGRPCWSGRPSRGRWCPTSRWWSAPIDYVLVEATGEDGRPASWWWPGTRSPPPSARTRGCCARCP